MNENTRTVDLYSGNDETAVAALRDFNSSDYISKLFEKCRNNDYRFLLDYFTSDKDDTIETHYWDIKMIPDSCSYEVMFNEHFNMLMEKEIHYDRRHVEISLLIIAVADVFELIFLGVVFNHLMKLEPVANVFLVINFVVKRQKFRIFFSQVL